MTEFKRELRYIVMKWKDVDVYLSPEESETLLALSSKICKGRQTDGKIPFNAVVVEQDWPEFEPTWAAIEARMSGNPSQLNILKALAIQLGEALVESNTQVRVDHCQEEDTLGLCYTCGLPLRDPEEDEHFVPGHHEKCPWVEREKSLKTVAPALAEYEAAKKEGLC